jgi:crotonobetainyl-CoA:carnitine CoA-transferase CaiB-like acyl-CoA transferase
MLATTGYIMSPYLVRYDGAPAFRLADKGQHGFSALYRMYRAASGWIFVSCINDAHWRALAGAVGRESWLADPRLTDADGRLSHDEELSAALGSIFATGSAEEWTARCDAAGVPAAVVCEEPQEAWYEQQKLLMEASQPIFGDYWRPPVKIDFETLTPRLAPAAAIGEHSRSLLAELGYPPGEVQQLVDAGAVGVWHRPGETTPYPNT